MRDGDAMRMGAGRNDLMAAWLATGGAVEAVPDGADDWSSLYCADDGIEALSNTALASCVDGGGLAAARPTQNFTCGDDAQQAGSYSRAPMCADDGLGAMTNTALASCRRDDGLAAGGPSRSFPCGDDAQQAGSYSRTPPMCADDGLVAGRPSLSFPCLDEGLQAYGLSRAC